MDGSGIVVNTFELQSVTSEAKTQTVLARDLLELVFTEEALKTCSLSGGLTKKGEPARPGLNPTGVNAILGIILFHFS